MSRLKIKFYKAAAHLKMHTKWCVKITRRYSTFKFLQLLRYLSTVFWRIRQSSQFFKKVRYHASGGLQMDIVGNLTVHQNLYLCGKIFIFIPEKQPKRYLRKWMELPGKIGFCLNADSAKLFAGHFQLFYFSCKR